MVLVIKFSFTVCEGNIGTERKRQPETYSQIRQGLGGTERQTYRLPDRDKVAERRNQRENNGWKELNFRRFHYERHQIICYWGAY